MFYLFALLNAFTAAIILAFYAYITIFAKTVNNCDKQMRFSIYTFILSEYSECCLRVHYIYACATIQ